MQKWEVCWIQTQTVKTGWNWARIRASAILFTPEGSQVINEIESDTRQADAFGQMIAKLGLDGWEPMPVYIPRVNEGEMSWYFKRSTSANAG